MDHSGERVSKRGTDGVSQDSAGVEVTVQSRSAADDMEPPTPDEHHRSSAVGSDPGSDRSDPPVCAHADYHGQAPARGPCVELEGLRGDATRAVDEGGALCPPSRTSGSGGGGASQDFQEQDASGGGGGGPQQGRGEEECAAGPCGVLGDQDDRERDDPHLATEGHGPSCGHCGTGRNRQGRLRQVREPKLHARQDLRRAVLSLGSHYRQGRRVLDVPQPVCQLADQLLREDDKECQAKGGHERVCAEEGCQEEDRTARISQLEPRAEGTIQFKQRAHRSDDEAAHGSSGHLDRGGEDAERGPWGEDAEDRGQAGCDDGPHADHDPGQGMSMLASRALEHKSELVIPHMFQDLMGQSRVDLFEISGEADSLLTEEFRARTGRSDSACRSALWSGQDLSTPEGLALSWNRLGVFTRSMCGLPCPVMPSVASKTLTRRPQPRSGI